MFLRSRRRHRRAGVPTYSERIQWITEELINWMIEECGEKVVVDKIREIYDWAGFPDKIDIVERSVASVWDRLEDLSGRHH